MNIIIAGGRDFKYTKRHIEFLDSVINNIDDVCIISGGARGADAFGEEYASRRGYKLLIFKADWDKYGKSAGYKRNVEMANNADMLIAFYDGKSKGTGHMIQIAKDKNIDTLIVNY